jgi:hypothetical protein
MIKAQNPNIQILKLAVDGLGELANEMVFLGGCAIGLADLFPQRESAFQATRPDRVSPARAGPAATPRSSR